MNGHGKSDSAIVAAKPTNKAGQPAAEPVERRAEEGGDRFGDGDDKLVEGVVVMTARQNLNAIERRVDRIEARPTTFRL